MPYITREDGTRFVTPSYRDILSAKKASLLKKEILLLSGNYGEYITLHKKNADQYEAAFSNETGYLLGETVWSYFNKPSDLIYCEALRGTTEAILVIVKGGSVYLDGSFPIDSIADELVVFQTERSQFQVFVHGDLPISKDPEEGKFSLNKSSVKSFTLLDKPLFPTLPTVKEYQLGLAQAVLFAQGIGVFPVKQVGGVFVSAAFLFMLWFSITTYIANRPKEIVVVAQAPTVFFDKLQGYKAALRTPSPMVEMKNVLASVTKLYTAPGWAPTKVMYQSGSLAADMQSAGTRIKPLAKWAELNKIKLQVQPSGVHVQLDVRTENRANYIELRPLQDVLAELIDRESYVIHGNRIKLDNVAELYNYSSQSIAISVDGVSIDVFNLIAEQFKGLPLVLSKADLTMNNGRFTGIITLAILGS